LEDQDGKNKAIPGLLITDKIGVRRFARSKQRKEEAFIRDSQFDAAHFKANEYLEKLAIENVKIALR